ncbi:GRIP and coiled-coil domain-containing protein 2-like isoform X1 [Eublepharis macularius]|uniref:GRIP and coiled-coil domain-containing protein 2-like isoform X1 n=1 Tax=Eublepharis macularius TaxID=481883 RepID=A0AA97J9A2_EUBMA|nr:GRIP and coiled-coil domain-containing protein 2-like isoform X1 [Eublepharis macularius]XP_054833353.1 GRIP and coiled-coil domain-containing protein 2-like isoform X1 [Eublepharis macularius]XP_054833354.1 GRIP and coiled-coil domain-containing protein 2-like isoform X1 [Eublepharis macularius]
MDSPNNFCRLCGSVLRGNHRRWLFSRNGRNTRPDLLVVLSYVLSRETPCRGDGHGEFLCGKCAQALVRVYRFDTVIARVQALSIDRLQRLLSEKDQLARSLRFIHAQRFPDDSDSVSYAGQEISASIADLPHVRYQRLLQDDMALSEYECWASDADSSQLGTPCRNRRCRSCHGLRVEDSDYEWVCQTPRKLGLLSPVFPLCRDKSQSMPTVHYATSQVSIRSQSLGDAESCSMLSLDTLPESDLAWEALKALKDIRRKHLRVPEGSKIPVLVGNGHVSAPRRESPSREELYEEVEDEFVPVEPKLQARQILCHDLRDAFGNLKARLEAAEEELRCFQENRGENLSQEAGTPPKKAVSSQEQLIQQLTRSLHSKEEVLQDCLVVLQSLGSLGVQPLMSEASVKQMAQRLKERDQALEKTLSSHFSALESQQLELRHLQEAMKDKDTDLARLNAALRTGEETLHVLREVLHQKDQEIWRLERLCASTRESWQQRDQTLLLALKEKEALIEALQGALASSNKDVEALANSFSSSDFAPGLFQRLQEKEDLLAQALAEQERIRAQWQSHLRVMEEAAATREKELQEQLCQRSLDAQERARETEKLRRRLAELEAELAKGAAALEECQSEVARLHRMGDEKDRVLEEVLREAEKKDQMLQKLQGCLLDGRHALGMKRMPDGGGNSLPPAI